MTDWGIGGQLNNQASRLDLGRAQALSSVQQYLEGLYPGLVRARSIQADLLTITTAQAPVASELRLRQVEILAGVNLVLPAAYKIGRIKIHIRA